MLKDKAPSEIIYFTKHIDDENWKYLLFSNNNGTYSLFRFIYIRNIGIIYICRWDHFNKESSIPLHHKYIVYNQNDDFYKKAMVLLNKNKILNRMATYLERLSNVQEHLYNIEGGENVYYCTIRVNYCETEYIIYPYIGAKSYVISIGKQNYNNSLHIGKYFQLDSDYSFKIPRKIYDAVIDYYNHVVNVIN